MKNIHFYFIKRLVLLRLATNHIGDHGVQYIADALKTNQVIIVCLVILNFFFYSIQTLTSLILESNQITDQGVQFIAEALKTNQVLAIYFSSHYIFSSLIHIDTHVT